MRVSVHKTVASRVSRRTARRCCPRNKRAETKRQNAPGMRRPHPLRDAIESRAARLFPVSLVRVRNTQRSLCESLAGPAVGLLETTASQYRSLDARNTFISADALKEGAKQKDERLIACPLETYRNFHFHAERKEKRLHAATTNAL